MEHEEEPTDEGGAASKVRYVRYVRTTSFLKVLTPLDRDVIMGVQAVRNTQLGVDKEIPFTYLRVANRTIFDMDLDYNSAIYGPFSKDNVVSFISGNCGNADVMGLDILLPGEFGSFMAAKFLKDHFASHRYVIHLDHYPCSRDGEKNAFWADVRNFMEPEDTEWMQPASLDFSFVLPDTVFKEVSKTKGRVSADYKHQLDQWKRDAGSNWEVMRKAVDLSFPRDYTAARTYRWVAEDTWKLDKVGDF